MNKSAINYCDRVWNVTGGCTHCSPGCDNCWAKQLTDTRYKHNPRYDGLTKDGRWTGEVKLFEDRLDQPLRVKKPQVVFVNSQSDLFHEQVPFEFIDKVMAIAALCLQHEFLFLTKREKRMMRYINRRCTRGNISIELGGRDDNCDHCFGDDHNLIWPLPNIYPGLTICNQDELYKLDKFLQIPGHKWLSIEPCLGNIVIPKDQLQQLSQIVVGGESGRDARPLHPDHPRSLRDQCKAAGVSFFFKQWGEYKPCDKSTDCQSCQDFNSASRHSWSTGNPGCSIRVGTTKAGRRLDGVEHNDLIWPSQAPRKRRCLGRP